MPIERNTLPGRPPAKLLASVRQTLRLYFQCRPERNNRTWLMTWEWANEISWRGTMAMFAKKRRHWPLASEIASQFLLLSLADMKSSHMLRLPYSAGEYMPLAVQERLRCGVPGLPGMQSQPTEPGQVVGSVPLRLEGGVKLGIPCDTEPHHWDFAPLNSDGTS